MSILLTTTAVAKRIVTSRDRVVDLIDSGDLRAIDIGRPGAKRKTWRIAEDELQRWLDSRTSQPAAQPQPRCRRKRAYTPVYY